jgi:iron-sulfur cluster insertion protein
MSEAAVADRSVGLTESAARRVQKLIDGEGDPNLMLRVQVSGGGCSGFQYGITLDSAKTDEDRLFEYHGVRMVIDETSLDLLNGAVVDYVEELVGASFKITNPNASSTCGCGSSFSV